MKNPEIDVSTFLKGASPSFQKYIEEGLAEIQRAAGDGSAVQTALASQMGDNRLGKCTYQSSTLYTVYSLLTHLYVLLWLTPTPVNTHTHTHSHAHTQTTHLV